MRSSQAPLPCGSVRGASTLRWDSNAAWARCAMRSAASESGGAAVSNEARVSTAPAVARLVPLARGIGLVEHALQARRRSDRAEPWPPQVPPQHGPARTGTLDERERARGIAQRHERHGDVPDLRLADDGTPIERYDEAIQ